MIHKKLLCSFAFMSFLLSHTVLLSVVDDALCATYLNALMELKVTDHGSNTTEKSMKDAWIQYIDRHPNEIKMDRLEHSLNPLYMGFSKVIATNTKNSRAYARMINNSGDDSLTTSSLIELGFEKFLAYDSIKEAFVNEGVAYLKSKENEVSFDTAITAIMSEFMKMHVELKLDGKLIDQSMQRQWERFIKHYSSEIDFSNVSNSLDALYGSFVKQIAEVEKNNKGRFQKLLQNHKDEALMGSRFKSFLENDQVKAEFMVLGEDTIKDMQPASNNPNPVPTENPSSTITPPPVPVLMTEKQVVTELTDPNLDPKSPEAVEAAHKFLAIPIDRALSIVGIENAFEHQQANITEQFANFPKEQPEMMEAAEIAKEILVNQVEEGNVNEPTSEPQNPISDAFRQRVQNDGKMIAQSLFNDKIFVATDKNIMTALQKINIMIWGLDQNSAKMAYLMGYVQNCIWNLQSTPIVQNISDDAVQAILRMAQTLRALNIQQARA